MLGAGVPESALRRTSDRLLAELQVLLGRMGFNTCTMKYLTAYVSLSVNVVAIAYDLRVGPPHGP